MNTVVLTAPFDPVTQAEMEYAAAVLKRPDVDAVILAVAHTEFSALTMEKIGRFFGEGKRVLLDLKGLLNRKECEAAGYDYWRL